MDKATSEQADAAPRLLLGGWAFVLFILICSALSYVDRQVISLLVEPLKKTLQISDTQVGLLQGFAFSLCYAIAGLPLALAIDRGNRAKIAAGCIALWSLAAGACGLAGSFITFLIARAATAITEAGFSPSVLSMLTDLVPRNKIARMSAAYLMGPPLGVGLSLLVGAWLLDYFNQAGGLTLPVFGTLEPWQSVFAALTLPGLALAIIFLTFIREPARREPLEAKGGVTTTLSGELKRVGPVLIPYVLGTTLIMTVIFANNAWDPAMFGRRYGLDPHVVGKTLGPVFIVSGLVGAVISSVFSGGGNEADAVRRVIKIVLVGAVCIGPAAIALALSDGYQASLALYALTGLSGNVVATLATAPIQLLISPHVRARAIALGGLVLAVIGAGGGPYVVGLITDRVFGDPTAVGGSLAIVSGVAAVGGIALILVAWRAARR